MGKMFGGQVFAIFGIAIFLVSGFYSSATSHRPFPTYLQPA
jgi:hypothetical protein